MYTILTNNRETSLFTDKVEYVSEVVEVPDLGEIVFDPTIVIFVQFVARNGSQQGQIQRIPLAHVNAICEKVPDRKVHYP